MPDDRGQPTLANFGDTSGLTSEQRSTLSAQLIKSGFDSSLVEEALTPGATSPTSASTAPATAALGLSLDPWKHPVLSDGEQQSLADNLKRHWTGDPALLNRALSEDSAATDDSDTAAADDPRTDIEQRFDAQFGGVSAGEYDLNGIYVNRPNVDAVATDSVYRATLSAMGVPPLLARGIASELLDSAALYASVPEGPAKQLWKHEQRAILERIGRASSEHLVRLAAHAISRAPEGARDFLMRTGSLESAGAILQLARQGERLFLRDQMAERTKARAP